MLINSTAKTPQSNWIGSNCENGQARAVGFTSEMVKRAEKTKFVAFWNGLT